MVYDRIKEANRTQEVLSKYSSVIRTRLGFHELSREVCSRVGTILVVLQGNHETFTQFQQELNEIGGIEVQVMKFSRN